MTIADYIVCALRLLAFGFGAWNLVWSYQAIRRLAKQPLTPVMFYLSVVYLLSLCSIAAQLGAGFEMAGWLDRKPWTIVALVLFNAALVAAAIGHAKGTSRKAQQFYGLYPHLDVVLPVADLASIDQEAAQSLATQARELFVAKTING